MLGCAPALRWSPPADCAAIAAGELGPALRADPSPPWRRDRRAARMVAAWPFPAAGEGAWLGLHCAWSDLDRREDLRPAVFAVDPSTGASRDLWKGSALGWPLRALAPLDGGAGRICAEHRGDSFVRLDPSSRGRRWQAWEWRGFGFRAVEEARCPSGPQPDLPTSTGQETPVPPSPQ